MSPKIILVGMMGCGKTSVSKCLGEILNLKTIDCDLVFEEKFNSTINDYFKNFGEDDFRKRESEILEDIFQDLKNESFILSTGGGVILSEFNRNLLFDQYNLSFYLKTSVENLYNRLKNDFSRPLLKTPNPKEKIKEILSSREKFYKCANYIIETDFRDISSIADEIARIYGKNSNYK